MIEFVIALAMVLVTCFCVIMMVAATWRLLVWMGFE